MPFCSDQCRLDDLGRWLDGGYVIAGAPVSTDEDPASHGPNGAPS